MYSHIPNVWEEKPGSRTLKLVRNGAQGHLEFYAYSMDAALYYAPKPGESHPLWPDLTVDTVDINGVESTAALINGEHAYWQYIVAVDYTLDYTKRRPGDGPRVSYDIGVETLSTAEGRTWVSTGRKAGPDITVAIPFPVMPFSVGNAYYAAELPVAAIFSCLGKINRDQFVLYSNNPPVNLMDASPETTLFEGADIEARYDYDLRNWYFDVTFRFTWRPFSHNIVWRTPDYLVDRSGNPLIYQNEDSGDAVSYTIDDTKIGLQIPRSDASGKAGWDEFEEPNYELADFSSLIPMV